MFSVGGGGGAMGPALNGEGGAMGGVDGGGGGGMKSSPANGGPGTPRDDSSMQDYNSLGFPPADSVS